MSDVEAINGQKSIQIELNILVLACQRKTAEEIECSLRTIVSLKYQIKQYSGPNPLSEELDAPLADVIILEMDGHRQEMLKDIRQFVERKGEHTEIFVTIPDPDVQFVNLLMRNGVRDVLPQPIRFQELTNSLLNSLSRHRHAIAAVMNRKGSISSFMNARGGAGASFLAVNIAYELAKKFKKNTVLVDMDVQFGMVANELDLIPDGGVMDALLNPDRIDAVFLDSLMVRHDSGLAVLSAPSNLCSPSNLKPNAVSRLLATLAKTHDHVVLSLPMYVDDAIEQAIRLSNPLFLVTQDTVNMLRSLNILLQSLPLKDIPLDNIEVIHNRSGGAVKDVSNSELHKLLEGVRLHHVHNDYKKAVHSSNRGKAVSELYLHGSMVRDLRGIAKYLVESGQVEAPNPQKNGFKHWFS